MAEGSGNKRRDTIRLVTDYSAGTLEMGLSVAIGVGIGYWLDRFVERQFHVRTTPWLTLFWLLCGVLAGFRALYRVARRLGEQERKSHDDADAS